MFASDDVGKLILRLTTGGLILFHGVHKLFDISGTVEWMGGTLAAHGLPSILAYGVFVGEVVAAIMLILGIYSRIGGLLVAVNMLFAFFLVHTATLFTLGSNGGWALELQGFYLFTGLAIFFLGGGRYVLKGDGLYFK